MLKFLPFYSLKVNFILKYIPLIALTALTTPEDRSQKTRFEFKWGFPTPRYAIFGKSPSLSWEFLNRRLPLKFGS